MSIKKIILTVLVFLLFVLVFIFGARVGHNLALKKFDKEYRLVYKNKLISDINLKLHILYSLRTNDYNKATAALEDYIDTDLFSLADYERVQQVSDKEIEKIAESVKVYRDKYNDHRINPRLEKTINSLLNTPFKK